jgi:hypothetical protein
MVLLLVGAVVLTGMALADDYYAVVGPKLGLNDAKKLQASHEFMQAREDAEHDAHRTDELINRFVLDDDGNPTDPLMIPKQGAVYLLRNDPKTRGPRLFKQHCASCHSY